MSIFPLQSLFMRKKLIIIAITLASIVLGSLGATVGYAVYLRSDSYCDKCARELSESLENMPTTIGSVVPRSHRAREFRDIRVKLPGGDDVFVCSRAIVSYDENSDYGEDDYSIKLIGGKTEISTRTWLHDDYRLVIESGLRPGMANGLRKVEIQNMDLTFIRNGFSLAIKNAGGVIEFDESATAKISNLQCRQINDFLSLQPIQLDAAFSLLDGNIQVDYAKLDVPEIPMEILNVGNLLGGEIQGGVFKSGRITYSEKSGKNRTVVEGRCESLDLAELTAGRFEKPWRGHFPSIDLAELRVDNGMPTRLRFSGKVKDLMLEDCLSLAGMPSGGGRLEVGFEADLSASGVDGFKASGKCKGLSLEAFTRDLGWGQMTGDVDADIGEFQITDNHLVRMDVDLSVADRDDGTNNWIDKRLLLEIVGRVFEIELPNFITEQFPDRIEYVECGVGLRVRDEKLFLLGSHGDGGRDILTLAQNEIPLVKQQDDPIDLTDVLGRVRTEIKRAFREKVGSRMLRLRASSVGTE